MRSKVYLNNVDELTSASAGGEKVFLEYGNKTEEIENAKEYQKQDWLFTMKVLGMAVKFFKA